MNRLAAERDPRLVARIVSRRPLLYDEGAVPALDRPAIVRSASGVAPLGDLLAIIQDDANFVALVDRGPGTVSAITLPADESGARLFDDVRGNKARKLDLESCIACVVDGGPRLLAFGSGSSPARERVASVGLPGSAPPRIVALPSLYAAFRADTRFSGSELNIEGAVLAGGHVRFFQRGNGAPRGALLPVNATADVPLAAVLAALEGSASPIHLEHVTQYDLGRTGKIPLTFTDATRGVAGSILYTAAAEDSPDATRDGPVTGAVLGVLREGAAPRFCPFVDREGAPVRDKIEGITLDPESPRRALVVIDADDPLRASELCEVELEGPWS